MDAPDWAGRSASKTHVECLPWWDPQGPGWRWLESSNTGMWKQVFEETAWMAGLLGTKLPCQVQASQGNVMIAWYCSDCASQTRNRQNRKCWKIHENPFHDLPCNWNPDRYFNPAWRIWLRVTRLVLHWKAVSHSPGPQARYLWCLYKSSILDTGDGLFIENTWCTTEHYIMNTYWSILKLCLECCTMYSWSTIPASDVVSCLWGMLNNNSCKHHEMHTKYDHAYIAYIYNCNLYICILQAEKFRWDYSFAGLFVLPPSCDPSSSLPVHQLCAADAQNDNPMISQL